MSLCIRVIPCKLQSLVATRNQIVKLDRRLTKHISTSTHVQKCGSVCLRNNTPEELTLTTSLCKTTIGFNNAGVRCYSTAAVEPKKSVDLTETNIKTQNSPDDEKNCPSQQALQHVFNTLKEDLPNFFVRSINYTIYDQDIEFINNFKNITYKGLTSYIKQVLYLRTGGHLIYAYVKYDVIKITMHPEDNTVKVRWRIRGLSGLKVFTGFWRFRLFKMAETLSGLESWHDGFSTYYVGSNGKVYRHIADKMMPDDDKEPVKDKPDIAAKLAA